MDKYVSKGCAYCDGIYGIQVDENEYECPMCGAKTIGHAKDL